MGKYCKLGITQVNIAYLITKMQKPASQSDTGRFRHRDLGPCLSFPLGVCGGQMEGRADLADRPGRHHPGPPVPHHRRDDEHDGTEADEELAAATGVGGVRAFGATH